MIRHDMTRYDTQYTTHNTQHTPYHNTTQYNIYQTLNRYEPKLHSAAYIILHIPTTNLTESVAKLWEY